MINLPVKDSNLEIKGVPWKNGKGEFLGYLITDTHDWKICEIHDTTPEGVADQIATAIREARDTGFEQGRAHVRKALGI